MLVGRDTLIPDGAAAARPGARSRLVRHRHTDADGRVRTDGVPAGEYLVLATDDVDGGSRLDTDVFVRLRTRAGFAQAAGEGRTIDLDLDEAGRDPR